MVSIHILSIYDLRSRLPWPLAQVFSGSTEPTRHTVSRTGEEAQTCGCRAAQDENHMSRWHLQVAKDYLMTCGIISDQCNFRCQRNKTKHTTLSRGLLQVQCHGRPKDQHLQMQITVWIKKMWPFYRNVSKPDTFSNSKDSGLDQAQVTGQVKLWRWTSAALFALLVRVQYHSFIQFLSSLSPGDRIAKKIHQ